MIKKYNGKEYIKKDSDGKRTDGSSSKFKNDILLGVGLVCLAICFWGIMLLLGNSHGNRVFITVDGNEFGMYNLNENKRIEVSEHNIVVIEGGKVYMEWADCPDKLCINQGKIAKTGQTIICLPNKVMVTIKGEAGEYDAIVR